MLILVEEWSFPTMFLMKIIGETLKINLCDDANDVLLDYQLNFWIQLNQLLKSNSMLALKIESQLIPLSSKRFYSFGIRTCLKLLFELNKTNVSKVKPFP